MPKQRLYQPPAYGVRAGAYPAAGASMYARGDVYAGRTVYGGASGGGGGVKEWEMFNASHVTIPGNSPYSTFSSDVPVSKHRYSTGSWSQSGCDPMVADDGFCAGEVGTKKPCALTRLRASWKRKEQF